MQVRQSIGIIIREIRILQLKFHFNVTLDVENIFTHFSLKICQNFNILRNVYTFVIKFIFYGYVL